MAVVSEVAHRTSEGAHRTASRVARRPPGGRSNLATRQQIRSSSLPLGEARRAWNLDRIGLVTDLRCECTRPTCRATVPAVADTHRTKAAQFIVTSTHFDGGLVVRAADRFFVVEPRGDAVGHSSAAEGG